MSYERTCLCCRYVLERRHFLLLEDRGELRLSMVCERCIFGRPRPARTWGEPSDGLWRIATKPAEFMALGVRV